MAIKLNRQIYIYSVDTSCFYNEKEQKIHNKLLKYYKYRNILKNMKSEYPKYKKKNNDHISFLKDGLYDLFKKNNEIRTLRNDSLKDNKVISLFDSTLTRTIGAKQNQLCEDIIVVQAFFFEVLEDIIHNGFIYQGEKYCYFSSSAGQIRTKKSVFLKQSVWEKYQNTLTCGLSAEEINRKGGININKYQAYLALSNSASDEWGNFDIRKSIVVEDLETNVFSEVDFINRDTFEIERKKMNIPITHTDGCGMILVKKSKKSFMCRLPFIKGLLVPFPYDEFAEENNSYVVKDIYGKEWNIKEDNIEIIFTKSQFKMWKYYEDWKDYQDKFIKYKCKAAKLNEEDVSLDSYLNYQMLQSLTDISNEELKKISESTIEDIIQLGKNKDVMLRILGATELNKNKNHFQQALEIYPELLNDIHAKEVIKDKKKSLIKDAKAAKLKINGKYTFLVPDLYAFCEFLFLGNKVPKGLLKNNEVYCDIFENVKLDCLRSPHLYREHAVRQNTVDDEKGKWFITRGIYTSVLDSISKILQFDNDGDKSLVVADETFVKISERNMKGIVPLYYEMAKAGAEEINYKNIYKSLTLAYKANIGIISNDITKIWNSDNVSLNAIKWLTMYTNFVIDYAKTLFVPQFPEHVKKEIHKYTKSKLPHFFIYAKDKEEKQVELLNNSVVNRLEKIIPNKPIQFKRIAGEFDYKMLMYRDNVNLNKEIINKYNDLHKNKKWKFKLQESAKADHEFYVYELIRNEMLSINSDASYIVDVLVKYLYGEKVSKNKETLWKSFGDILLHNLKQNIKNTKQCECCGKRINTYNTKKYCNDCAEEKERIRKRNWKRKLKSGSENE
jgi:ribosomal protein L37E